MVLNSLSSVAEEYLTYIGRHFPQQCASDEFYFFPRSEEALAHLNRLDDLNPERIQDHIHFIKSLSVRIPRGPLETLEDEIDRSLIEGSMNSFTREFEEARIWQKDATLYVKIPLFATARILSREDRPTDERETDLLTLFSQIPAFLRIALQNLESPPEIVLQTAIDMTADAIRFYSEDVRVYVEKSMGKNREISRKNRAVLDAWEDYGNGLCRLSTNKNIAVGEDRLGKIIRDGLACPKTPEEILIAAQDAFQRTSGEIRLTVEKLGKGNGKESRPGPEPGPAITRIEQILPLFKKQVEDLRRFFRSGDHLPLPDGDKVRVLQTPAYLRSLRAAASYCAPLTGDRYSGGIFYITPEMEDLKTVAQHSPYLCAHETYPGHHLLDLIRIHHPNPVRRQMESPLFYEGWACYAERMLDELGYIRNPARQLVGLRRLLWRELRAQLDVKLQTGRMSVDEAAKQIESLGYTPERALRQARHFCLTPGYQLCYFVGVEEILSLRKQFSSRCGMKGFHETLLSGGEIPFPLVEKRFEEGLNENG